MTRSDIDWSVLRGSLIMLLITIVIAIAVVVGSGYFEDEKTRDFKRDQRSFLAASRKYLSVDEEERLVREYLPRFEQMAAEGLIGEEQRLQWLETLRQAKADLRLPTLQYSVSPRSEFEPPEKLPKGDFMPYASQMELTAGLVHEADLFRLFDTLEQRARGVFDVDSCALNRRGRDDARPEPDKANISATCRLSWITLRNPSS